MPVAEAIMKIRVTYKNCPSTDKWSVPQSGSEAVRRAARRRKPEDADA